MNNFKIRYGNEYIEFSTKGQEEVSFGNQEHITSGNYYGFMISDDEVGNPNAEITVQFLIEDCHKSGMSFEALRVKLGAFKRFSDKVNWNTSPRDHEKHPQLIRRPYDNGSTLSGLLAEYTHKSVLCKQINYVSEEEIELVLKVAENTWHLEEPKVLENKQIPIDFTHTSNVNFNGSVLIKHGETTVVKTFNVLNGGDALTPASGDFEISTHTTETIGTLMWDGTPAYAVLERKKPISNTAETRVVIYHVKGRHVMCTEALMELFWQDSIQSRMSVGTLRFTPYNNQELGQHKDSFYTLHNMYASAPIIYPCAYFMWGSYVANVFKKPLTTTQFDSGWSPLQINRFNIAGNKLAHTDKNSEAAKFFLTFNVSGKHLGTDSMGLESGWTTPTSTADMTFVSARFGTTGFYNTAFERAEQYVRQTVGGNTYCWNLLRPNLSEIRLVIFDPQEYKYELPTPITLPTASTQYRAANNFSNNLFFRPSLLEPDTKAMFFMDGAEHFINRDAKDYFINYRDSSSGNMREVYKGGSLWKGLVVIGSATTNAQFKRLRLDISTTLDTPWVQFISKTNHVYGNADVYWKLIVKNSLYLIDLVIHNNENSYTIDFHSQEIPGRNYIVLECWGDKWTIKEYDVHDNFVGDGTKYIHLITKDLLNFSIEPGTLIMESLTELTLEYSEAIY